MICILMCTQNIKSLYKSKKRTKSDEKLSPRLPCAHMYYIVKPTILAYKPRNPARITRQQFCLRSVVGLVFDFLELYNCNDIVSYFKKVFKRFWEILCDKWKKVKKVNIRFLIKNLLNILLG